MDGLTYRRIRIATRRLRRYVHTSIRLYLYFQLAITLSSCDLFSTRTPSDPDFGSTFIWTPAATPNYLLANFKGTIEVLDATNYTKCFMSPKDSSVAGDKSVFIFTPRSGLDASSRSKFDGWNIQSEQNFMTNLRSSLVSNPRLTVTFSNTKISQSNSNAADITTDYLVLLPVQSNSSIPPSISGSMILHVILVTTEQATSEWRITTWSDFAQQSGNSKTFTELKAQLSS